MCYSCTFNHLKSLSTENVLRNKEKKIKMKFDSEEGLMCKMSYHLDQPHEPISVHPRWPSQSWQGTLQGWGSLDWRWRTRSSLALETRCPLAGPQQEPEATTMSNCSYCKNTAAVTLWWLQIRSVISINCHVAWACLCTLNKIKIFVTWLSLP